jgi:hypothetical protein
MSEVHDRMSARLAELREDLRQGEAQLRELMQREAALREAMLRISGAVQVLEEVLDEPRGPSGNGFVGMRDDRAEAPRGA